MPAIDPARLEREIKWILQAISEPATLRRRVLRLLDVYSDPKLHARKAGKERGTQGIHVPEPLIKQLGRDLRRGTAHDPALAWRLADELFKHELLEMQRLAVAVLPRHDGRQLATWAERNAPNVVEPLVLSELCSAGLIGWRRAHPRAFLETASAWLGSRQKRVRLLGLLALYSAVRDEAFEDMPSIFSLLSGHARLAVGESLPAMIRLVRALAQRSAPETARYLLDELVSDRDAMKGIVQSSLEAFPRPLQSKLRDALAGKQSMV